MGRETPDTRLSKALSSILRHNAVKEGVPISNDGYILISDLQRHPRFKQCTLADFQRIVANDSKQRYTLLNDPWRIRANQGHSMDHIHVEMVEITEPCMAIHGTSNNAWEKIKESGGLSKMNRVHIHMASGKLGQVKSGIRPSSKVLIYVDMKKCMDMGIKFWKSSNGVILSEGNENGMIPLDCLTKEPTERATEGATERTESVREQVRE